MATTMKNRRSAAPDENSTMTNEPRRPVFVDGYKVVDINPKTGRYYQITLSKDGSYCYACGKSLHTGEHNKLCRNCQNAYANHREHDEAALKRNYSDLTFDGDEFFWADFRTVGILYNDGHITKGRAEDILADIALNKRLEIKEMHANLEREWKLQREGDEISQAIKELNF